MPPFKVPEIFKQYKKNKRAKVEKPKGFVPGSTKGYATQEKNKKKTKTPQKVFKIKKK